MFHSISSVLSPPSFSLLREEQKTGILAISGLRDLVEIFQTLRQHLLCLHRLNKVVGKYRGLLMDLLSSLWSQCCHVSVTIKINVMNL